MFSSRREGHSRRTPGFHRKSLFQLVLALAAGRPVFNGGLFVVDGGSGKTRAAADYNGFADTHWLDQSDTTKQCALPAGHADYLGNLCLNFTGSEWYRSTRAAPAFSYMVTGAAPGYEFFLGVRLSSSTGVVVCTGNGATDNLTLYLSAGAATFQLYASPTLVLSRSSGVILDTVTSVNGYYIEGGSPEFSLKVSGAAASSTSSAASPPAAPTATLNLFNNSAGGQMPTGRWRNFMQFPFLSDAARNTVVSYQQTQGLAA